MINFDLQNLNLDFGEYKNSIKDFLQKIESRNQGFYKILDDEETTKKVQKFTVENKDKFTHIVILGIGGSALGTICLKQSLKHLYQNELSENPKLYILDNIDPVLIQETEDIIKYENTLFIVITKSGTTPETLSQYYYFRKKIEEKNLKPQEHFVFITDPEKGLLREIATKENIPSFSIPENVGGRFSVLTPVGLLPAALIGIDIQKLIEGAKKIRDQFLNENFRENLPYQLALIQFLQSQKEQDINVLMPYAQKLICLADWYKQLLAESIGKTEKIGLTPVNALGVTDQHSQLQLYNDGPNDKLIIFIEVEDLGPKIEIPNFGKNITFDQLLKIEKNATAESLKKSGKPNMTIKITKVDEENLGELFMLFEGSIAFLGEFFEIDAFDQPGVELSKKLTKEALTKI